MYIHDIYTEAASIGTNNKNEWGEKEKERVAFGLFRKSCLQGEKYKIMSVLPSKYLSLSLSIRAIPTLHASFFLSHLPL